MKRWLSSRNMAVGHNPSYEELLAMIESKMHELWQRRPRFYAADLYLAVKRRHLGRDGRKIRAHARPCPPNQAEAARPQVRVVSRAVTS